MGLKKTPRAFIDVLDAEGKITGHEVEYFLTYEAEDEKDPMASAFQSSVKREEVSAEEMAKLRDGSDNALTAENTALHAVIVREREMADAATEQASTLIADLRGRAVKAEEAVQTVADAFKAFGDRIELYLPSAKS